MVSYESGALHKCLMSNIYNTGQDSDVNLLVETSNRKFRAHQWVLKGIGQYFKTLLGDLSENDHVLVPNITEACFELVLKYIYLGEVVITDEIVAELTTVSKNMQLDHLFKSSLKFIVEHSSKEFAVQNMIALASLGKAFDVEGADEFVEKSMRIIKEQDKYLELDFETVRGIVELCKIAKCSEEEKVNFFSTWVNYYPDDRIPYFDAFVNGTDIQRLSSKFILEQLLPLCNSRETRDLVKNELLRQFAFFGKCNEELIINRQQLVAFHIKDSTTLCLNKFSLALRVWTHEDIVSQHKCSGELFNIPHHGILVAEPDGVAQLYSFAKHRFELLSDFPSIPAGSKMFVYQGAFHCTRPSMEMIATYNFETGKLDDSTIKKLNVGPCETVERYLEIGQSLIAITFHQPTKNYIRYDWGDNGWYYRNKSNSTMPLYVHLNGEHYLIDTALYKCGKKDGNQKICNSKGTPFVVKGNLYFAEFANGVTKFKMYNGTTIGQSDLSDLNSDHAVSLFVDMD